MTRRISRWRNRALWSVLLQILWLCACDAGPGVTDASLAVDGGQTDAGSSPDTGAMADAGPLDAVSFDAGAPPFDAEAPADAAPPDAAYVFADTGVSFEDAGDIVAQCRASATDMAMRCGGGSDRECEWLAVRERCFVERADVLLADIDCARTFSSGIGGTSCPSFGDPSAARECLVASHRRFSITTAARDIAAAVDAAALELCGFTAVDSLNSFFIPLAAASASTLDDVADCVATTSTCDPYLACLRAVFVDIATCR